MIEYRKGCLIEALKSGEIDVSVHGCNCRGVMGSGIAKVVKQNWPNVFKKYCEYVDKHPSAFMLGDLIWVDTEHGVVVNMLTQIDYGKDGRVYVDYTAIKYGFSRLLRNTGVDEVIGIPKIGAGLGGGSWELIEKIINDQIDYAQINRPCRHKVVCYEL